MAAASIAQSILAGRKVLLWIGAGSSYNAGIPVDADTHDGLGYRLALIHFNNDQAQIAAELGERFRVAELAALVQKRRVRQLIMQQAWTDLEPGSVHRAIAAIAAEGFSIELVTVNYDPLLENGLRSEYLSPAIVCSAATVQRLTENAVFVVKAHGCPFTDHDPDNLIMLQGELADPPAWVTAFLNGRLQERIFVYVGFSGNAPYVRECVERTTANLNGHVNEAYGVDIRPAVTTFAEGDALGDFYRASHVTEARYLSNGSDEAFRDIANHVFRGIMLQHFRVAERLAAQRGCDASVWLLEILNNMSYESIRALGKKVGILGTGKQPPRLRDLRISAILEWMLVLQAKMIIEASGFRPVLACPYYAGNNGLAAAPVVFFDSLGQDANMAAEQVTQMETRGELRILQVGGEPRWFAFLVNCRGRFSHVRSEIIARESDSILQRYEPIVFLDENTVLGHLDELQEQFR